jgi:hypothetical protein
VDNTGFQVSHDAFQQSTCASNPTRSALTRSQLPDTVFAQPPPPSQPWPIWILTMCRQRSRCSGQRAKFWRQRRVGGQKAAPQKPPCFDQCSKSSA